MEETTEPEETSPDKHEIEGGANLTLRALDDTTEEAVAPLTPSEPLPLVVEPSQDNGQKSLSEESWGVEHWCTQDQQLVCSDRLTLELQRVSSQSMVKDYAILRRAPCLAKLARLAEEIISDKTREEKAPNTAELEEPSCTPRRCMQNQQLVCRHRTTPELQRAPSHPMVQNYTVLQRAPCLAELARLAKEIIFGKAREEKAPNAAELSQTYLRPACTNIAIDNFVVVTDLETKNLNFELETKIGNQMEDSVLAKASIAENHRKLHGHKKKNVMKTIDNMKANDNYSVPRFQEPNSKKLITAMLARKMNFGTTKNKMPAIE